MKLVGPTGPAIPALLHNLAGLAHAQGRFDDAEQPARHALQLHERMWRAYSEEAAADASVLGAVLLGQERYAEAEILLNRAMTTWLALRYGHNHYEVAVNLHNLAALYRARGEVESVSPHRASPEDQKGNPRTLPPGSPKVGEKPLRLASTTTDWIFWSSGDLVTHRYRGNAVGVA